MENSSMIKKKLRRGFTLVEVLVVMLIIAILAAMVLPRIMGRKSDAQKAAALQQISGMQTALQQFRLDCDRYPTTDEGLDVLREQPSDLRGWKGPYMEKSIPVDPWGNPYVYEYPGANGDDSFNLYSYGADGAAGGEGDAADIGVDAVE